MLVNSKEILKKAKKESYAIPQFNINNLEWCKYIIEECNKLNVPVILGASEGAIKYMGGYNIVSALVFSIAHELDAKIDICLHLDHGASVESCKKAIDAGFNSVMIDASSNPLEENIIMTKEVVEYAKNANVTVEGEVGSIGGTEDTTTELKIAKFEDCIRYVKETGIDSLAAAVGSVHGLYKEEPNLQFDLIEKLNNNLDIPLVLHGGSGIGEKDIKTAIKKGISKININTELQTSWASAVREFLNNNKEVYDPRKVIGSGEKAIKKMIDEKINLFMTK